MNKHTETIEALRSLLTTPASLYSQEEEKEENSDDIFVMLVVSNKEIRKARRLLAEWDKKISDPPYIKRIRCKTCGTETYYENLIDERCPSCDEDMRIYLATALKEEEEKREGKEDNKEKKEKRTKKSISIEFIKSLRSLPPEERAIFMDDLSGKEKSFIRQVLTRQI